VKGLLKLISLEIRKNKMYGMIKGVLIANLAVLTLMVLMLLVDQNEPSHAFNTLEEMFDGLFMLLRAVFIVFASVIIGKLVIDEYKNNTISVLFMYPISRKKLLASKLIIVFFFTLFTIIVSGLVLGIIMTEINHYTGILSGTVSWAMLQSELVKLGFGALYASGIALIPLYFGMLKKSVPTTIISAVLLASVVSGDFNEFRLGNIAAVCIGLCLIGVVISYFSIRNVETEDIA
jgi:ABC-type transport system involved in multi-copper enzyme maturation permease subunit